MLATRIDGAASKALRGLTGSVDLDQTEEPGHQRNYKQRRMPGALMGTVLDLMRRVAEWVVSRPQHGDARFRWLELRNKISAYQLFDGCGRDGEYVRPEAICRLDCHSRLFAAEGYAYRNTRPGALVLECAPELSRIAIHAGAGLRLAEQTLRSIDAAGSEKLFLAEFSAVCGHVALEGHRGIMEESLGLVTRSMYPHLLERLDRCLRAMDASILERFWHGVGRAIYFAPTNMAPVWAAPWSGVERCLNEPPHETGRRNALSGYCFALAIVNLQEKEVLVAFSKHRLAQSLDCIHAMEAAMAVWTLSGGNSEAREIVAAQFGGSFARLQSRVIPEEYRSQPERLFSVRPQSQAVSYPGCIAVMTT
jgi:hypothetical protein